MIGLEPIQYIGLEYLYKITGLRPSQYPNTEMSPNQ